MCRTFYKFFSSINGKGGRIFEPVWLCCGHLLCYDDTERNLRSLAHNKKLMTLMTGTQLTFERRKWF